MTSKLTREQLHERARENVKALKMASRQTAFESAREEILADLQLAELALAAMDSEPVAVIDLANLDYLLSGADADVWPPEREEMGDVLLYRHPQPAPDLNSVIINDNHPIPNPPAENGIPKTAYCGEGLCLSEPITPDTIEGVLPPEMIARGNKIVNPRSAGLYLNDILHPAPVVPMENHIGSKNSLDAIVSFIKSKSNPTVKCYEEVSGQLFKDNCHGIHSHVIEYIFKLGEELEDLRAEQAEMQPAPVVQCPFPCGWDNLNKLSIQDAALVARGLVEGEPTTEAERQAAISNNDRLLKVISACRAATLAAAPQSPGSEPATVPGKWIPVSERMPDREVDVQVYCPDKKEQMVAYLERNELDGYFRFATWRTGDGIYCQPTHWMQLPAGPQEAKGE